MTGEQFDDPNRQAVGLDPVAAEAPKEEKEKPKAKEEKEKPKAKAKEKEEG